MSKREHRRLVLMNRRAMFLETWEEAKVKGVPLSAFCRDYGLCRNSFYRWLKVAGGSVGPVPIRRVDPKLKQKAIEIYLRYKGTWSAETISLALKGALSAHTIRKAIGPYRDLRKVDSAPRERSLNAVLRTPGAPNLIWSTDWTECRVSGRKYFILLVLDEAARFFLGWSILDHAPRTADVRAFFADLLARYEDRPLMIKSDRAKVFMSSEWEALLGSNGILPHRVRPRSPWEQGVIERAIRDLKAWIKAGRPENAAEFGACVDEGMTMLNFLKPRLVLDGRTPAAVYLGSSRSSICALDAPVAGEVHGG